MGKETASLGWQFSLNQALHQHHHTEQKLRGSYWTRKGDMEKYTCTHIQEKFENSKARSKENPLHYLHRFQIYYKAEIIGTIEEVYE